MAVELKDRISCGCRAHFARKQLWVVFDLLLAIRTVDEVIYLQEEIVVCGTLKWWGTMPCDLLGKPIMAEQAQCIWASTPSG